MHRNKKLWNTNHVDVSKHGPADDLIDANADSTVGWPNVGPTLVLSSTTLGQHWPNLDCWWEDICRPCSILQYAHRDGTCKDNPITMACKIMFQNNLIRAENDAIFHNDTQPIDLTIDRPLVRSDEKPPIKFQGDDCTYTRDTSWDLNLV